MAGHERTADDENPRATLPVTLSEFLRDHQSDIIGDWTQRMRSISPARELSDAAIVDHLPAILTRISELVGPHEAATPASLGPLPEVHAVDRLGRGFDLDEMVTEYGLLRRSILDLWESRVGPTLNLHDVRALDSAFDEALRRATVRHAQAREKLLKAVDRISVAALGSTDLDTFLEHLLSATRETTESVDTAVVLLRDGDILRVRAAVGVAPDLQLALSVSKREGIAGQVELHGGTITGMSAGKDQGATFRVRLPTAGVQLESLLIDRPAFSIDEPAPWRPPESSLEGLHVLAVDDHEDALGLVREILEATGARVTTLRSGAEVLERILTLHPDVLVADLGMPLMDGFEMIRRIRQLPDRALSDIPAIALTAYARSEDRVKALNSGFQMHIHKPLDPPELIGAIAALRAVTRRSGYDPRD